MCKSWLKIGGTCRCTSNLTIPLVAARYKRGSECCECALDTCSCDQSVMLKAHVHSGIFAWMDMLPGTDAYFIWPGYVRSFQVEGREACGQGTLAPVHLTQPERS